MIYRRYGRTELQMPVFSCGGMRYQHKWQDVPPGEIPPDGQANLEACIERALAAIGHQDDGEPADPESSEVRFTCSR